MKHNKPQHQSLSLKEVISSFKEKHGNFYNYDKVNYINNNEKVIIQCPKHGEFKQSPKDHKKGIGCIRCGFEKTKNSLKLTLNEFITRSKLRHNDKFDYSLVDLENNNTQAKVKIICPAHGIILQKAINHLKGFGCKKCDAQRIGNFSRKTHEQFIEKSISIHGDYYDYSKTIYTNSKNKVKIICKKHGEFIQQAKLHLRGNGCHQCSQSKGEKTISLWLNNNSIPFIHEKIFDDCVSPSGRPMKFDFYLVNQNMIIEFDGLQHYKPIDYFGGEVAFEKLKLYDKIKNEYCSSNHIKLIRIPHYLLENIHQILTNELSSIKCTPIF